MRPLTAAAAAAVLTLGVVGCGGGDDDEQVATFCTSLGAAAASSGPVQAVNLDDAASVAAAGDALDQVVSAAPSEIRAEAGAVADAYRKVIDELSAAPAPARDDVLAELAPLLAEVTEATTRFNSYADAECGLSLTAPAAVQATPTPTSAAAPGIEG